MLRPVLAAVALAALCSTAEAASISFTDVISSPDHFNGFEALTSFSLPGATHTEGGITVTQVNGQDDIVTTANFGGGMEGDRSWYPNGGDLGYTQISLEGGQDFGDVGFLASSGFNPDSPIWLAYSLFNDGVEVQSGVVEEHSYGFSYISFLGGGFDTIFLRDSDVSSATVFGGGVNGLALDSIKATAVVPSPVPLPAALPLFLAGLAGLGFVGWRKNRLAAQA